MKRGILIGSAIGFLLVGFAASTDAAAPKPDKDGWYELFNGKSLKGWTKAKENPNSIKFKDGEIVMKGRRCHLFYSGPVKDANFKNFEFKADVMTLPKANAGIFFHTKYQENGWPKIGYESQVNQTHGDPQKTGGLYNTAKVSAEKNPAKDKKWYTQHIIVNGNHVVVNIITDIDTDKPKVTKVVDYTQPKDKKQPCLSSGTFALQAHDPGSEIHFKNIKVKPLP